MMKHIEPTTTLVSWKLKLLLIITLCLTMCVILIISMFLLINRSTESSSNIISTLSSKEDKQFKDFLNISLNHQTSSSKIMKKFMYSIYNEIYIQKRRKRQLNFQKSNLILSDNIHSIISLFNQYEELNSYYFIYELSLENLIHIELILPIQRLTKFSRIHIQLNELNLLFQQPFEIEKNFLKINLTKYIQTFPLKFSIKFHQISLQSSGFLTLYFQQSHSRIRRDLSLLHDDNQLVTYSNDSTSCQVRRFHTTFADLNLTSSIVEPSSYEMNICSGICHTNSNMPSYLTMQNILHQISPKIIPTLCCKPTRFSSMIILYYDGPNLVLKRQDNMRVVECGCS